MDGKGVILLLRHLLLIVIGLSACASVYPAFGGQLVFKGKCIESEKQALLEFKQGLTDHTHYLSSWKGEEGDCCLWKGVGCHHQTGHIIKLDLSDCDTLDGDYCFSGKISNSLLKLPHLRHLDLLGFNFSESIPNFIGSLNNLRYLNLAFASYPPKTVIPVHISNLSNLHTLVLSYSNLQGIIPYQFGNMTSLERLDISNNNFQGVVPQFGNITSLEYLDISDNNFQGVLPQFEKSPNLRVLNLNGNNLTGFSQVSSSLRELRLGGNRFDSTSSLMESIGRLSNLNVLDISSNPSKTVNVITQAHLSNLSSLQALRISNIPVSISLDWVPPFQLQVLDFSSCSLGPHFPQWLQTQNNMSSLNISHNGISGPIPDWFWNNLNIIDTYSLEFLDLSHNNLSGILSDVLPLSPSSFIDLIYLNSNNFTGRIPSNLLNARELDLSNNFFSGTISVICTKLSENVMILYLSNNSLSGELPDCWSRFTNLGHLNLADNNFSGNIPESMGSLSLLHLHLRNNNFGGELPNLTNSTTLIVLDVRENNLSGNIPIWIGENLHYLVVLSLGSNALHGNIPPSICKLQYLQTLDLSLNKLSGGIPWCFDNFTSMSSETEFYEDGMLWVGWTNSGIRFEHEFGDSELVEWKGIEREYIGNCGIVKLIDLSSNKFSGTIPHQLTNLVYLVSLNLSTNYLSGAIPSRIGNLSSLDTLDLSRNQLSGEIPSSLSAVHRLSTLNLSCNNLSGRIPQSTQLQSFDPSVYGGNSRLCGPPLAACREDGGESDFRPDNHSDDQHTDHDELLSLPFYVGAILGFIVGFWGVFGSLVMKRSWRIAYFRWLSRVNDNVYVKIVVGVGKLKRRFQR